MFIDICVANGNEDEFIEVGKKIGTPHLCFLGKKTTFNFSINKTPRFFDFESTIQKNSVYVIHNLKRERRFNSPMKINHVYFKELKENNCLVAVSFNEVLKNPINTEKIKFIVRLCKKYKIPVIIASFAKKHSEIRAKKELLSLAKFLLLGNDVLENFSNFLAQDF